MTVLEAPELDADGDPITDCAGDLFDLTDEVARQRGQ